MNPVSGLDGVFLHLETPQTPMHVGSLHLFELPPGRRGDFYAAVRKELGRRMLALPVFRRKLAPMPLQFANPVWIDDPQVDLDAHVRRMTLPPPGTLSQLEEAAGRLHGELLDRSRPLWQLWVIDGLASGEVGYYVKVHHAVLDGQAGVLLAQALFDLEPKPAKPRGGKSTADAAPAGRAAARTPGAFALAAAALRHDGAQVVRLVRNLPEVAGTLKALVGNSLSKWSDGMGQNVAFGPHTPINVPITGERGFASFTIALPALKALAAAHEATLNDIVLALASGALRRYLARHGGIPRKPLIAAMPVSLRAAGNTDITTQATMTLVNLHTQLSDPVKRLHAIRDSAQAAKAMTGSMRNILPTDFPSITAPWLMHGLAKLYGRSGLARRIPPIANIVVSNVPGPRVPLYAAGARMLSYWPMSITEHGLGVNLTVMSYAGAVGFGFTTATSAVAHPHELVDALRDAYAELQASEAAPETGREAAKPVATGTAATAGSAKGTKPSKTAKRAKVANATKAGKRAGAARPAIAPEPAQTARATKATKATKATPRSRRRTAA